MFENKKILILAPHTDDELQCVGLLYKYKPNYVKLICFSSPDRTTSFECKSVFTYDSIDIKNYPIRQFNTYRQDILELIYKESKSSYDIVLCPSSFDTHQDHKVIRDEAFRAFKTNVSIFGFQSIHNDIHTNYTLFVEINKLCLDKKINAINKYVSQRDKKYFNNDVVKSIAMVNGLICGCQYAEAYEVIRIKQ